MAVTVKKKATAEVSVQKKAKGQVLLEETTATAVDTPQFAEAEGEPGAADPPLHVVDAGTGMVMQTLMPAQQAMPYCEIGFEASFTHNMTNYESCRVNVSLKVPCLHSEIDEAFDYAKGWVEDRLNKVNEEIKG